ncbi:MAG: DNA gyrase subunit A [Spirochaetia bacterium]|nr:DNA gyrase subunit A [Spirochaetia bacterium]
MAKKKDDKTRPLKPAKEIIPVEIEDQMKQSYLAYAMSVIVGRALPDVRDGLKPVHRRILHAMNERAWRHDRAYVKSAKIVGEVIGNFHPHGDVAVYDTMVRMAQEFSLRVPLIDGQGNFGSVDGDPPAAYRYTEARLTTMAEELLKDIDKQTVDFSPNFDNTRKEPVVLPAAWPNLLVNGSSGIAVGMATKIPPHNLNEVITALELLIQKPNCTIRELMKIIPAPDFPTGGTIIGKEGLQKAYTTGKGSLKIRATSEIEQSPRGRDCIIITSIPYEVKKADLISKIAALVNDKKIEGLADIRDESDKKGMRIVFELKKDANTQIVLNQLYSRSNLQVNYGIIFLALVNQRPLLLNLKQMLEYYLAHRKEIVIKRTQFELDQAKKRAHILEGLKIALDFIDQVIKLIRGSKTVEAAREGLMSNFKLTEIQANAILDMRLQKLTALESKKIIEELENLRKIIKELTAILKSEARITGIISDELGDIKKKFGAERKSGISLEDVDITSFDQEDLIQNVSEVVTISEGGFIKRVALDTFKRQARGGKGVISGGKKEDNISFVHLCQSLDTVFFFSNRGKVFYLKTYELPESSKDARGKSLRSFLSLGQDEYITAIRSTDKIEEDKFLLLLTRNGIIKKLSLSSLKNAKKGGIMAIQFKNNSSDWLIDFVVVKDKDDVFMASANGLALRTNLARMRPQGRTASGIIGMSLAKGDYMAGLDVIKDKDMEIIVMTENGFGKRLKASEFASKGRGGKGMIYMKASERNGKIAAIRSVHTNSEIISVSKNGMTIRLLAKDISLQGRSASGIKIINISENDTVADITVSNNPEQE